MNCTTVANSEGPVTCTNASDSQASACLPGYTRSAGIPTICSGMWANDEAVFQLLDSHIAWTFWWVKICLEMMHLGEPK
jgi:hypothetical protein